MLRANKHAAKWLLIAGALAANVAWAWPVASLADCDADAPTRVLQASPALADARAIWLDASRLRWPGKSNDAVLRLLLRSAEAAQQVASPSDSRGLVEIPLEPTSARFDTDASFHWIGEGAQRQVAAGFTDALGVMWQGELLLVEEDADGRVLDTTRIQHAAALDDRYAKAHVQVMGVRLGDGYSRLRVWAPTARAVSLCRYADDHSSATALAALVRDPETGSWSLQSKQDYRDQYYTYLVDVFVPGTGWVRNRVTDPYSISLGADSRRSYIADLSDEVLKPEGWDTAPVGKVLAHNTDAVIYELQVRDFSRDDASVPEAERGKYSAFTHANSDGMRHLRALAEAGLTDVQLLPVFDFASVPEIDCVSPAIPTNPSLESVQAAVKQTADRDCFNWGYDPMHYGAPEGSYASVASEGAARVREFRAMVMALHAAGLRVGMDVVYNHTFAAGQDARSVLDRIVPGYYHRLDNTGRITRSTCCENTATEHPMMAKLMVDTVSRWVRDYRIDSFRFDLMGHQPRTVMERLQTQVDRVGGGHRVLIGEGWNFGEVADGARFVQASQSSLSGSGIATFSDRARDAVRGGGCCDSGAALVARKGWVNTDYQAADHDQPLGKTLADSLRAGLTADTKEPGEVVNYVENHDNLTLFDSNALKLPAGTPPVERARVQLLALATVAFSQGIAYFHAGGELLRSKSLDRNSFNSGDAFNRLDWTLTANGFGIGLPPADDNRSSWPVMRAVLMDPSVPATPDTIRWARAAFLDLLRIRASTVLLHLQSAAAIQQRVHVLPAEADDDGAVVAVWIDGDGLPDSRWQRLAYLFNADVTERQITIPELAGYPFQLHPLQASTRAADSRPRQLSRFDQALGRFTVPARSVVVYVLENAD